MTESTRPDAPVEPAAPAPAPAPAKPAPEPAAVSPDPVNPWAVSAEASAAEAARKAGRTTALRWGATALLLLLSGTATAVAVTAQDRTDIPGLRTTNDGRYAFPALTLPPLPSGKPVPSADPANRRHYADLRGLLLPAPKGASDEAGPPAAPATAVASAAPSAGTSPSASTASSTAAATPAAPSATAVAGAARVSCADYANRHKSPAVLTAMLDENACRAAARRVWTGPDGTRTEIWLLSFGSRTEAAAFARDLGTDDLKDVPALLHVSLPIDVEGHTTNQLLQTKERAAGKDPVGRVAELVNGDVFGSVVMTNPKGVPLQAFQQVTILQSVMLD
ncbi:MULTISPECIES: hypothetical protein [Kitasatospora]|uniref:Uncharacterized protein n=1 Tax=Kitasatospora cystarginea TaxID=58350 RepID=A0ABP5R714_9ACTN